NGRTETWRRGSGGGLFRLCQSMSGLREPDALRPPPPAPQFSTGTPLRPGSAVPLRDRLGGSGGGAGFGAAGPDRASLRTRASAHAHADDLPWRRAAYRAALLRDSGGGRGSRGIRQREEGWEITGARTRARGWPDSRG